MTPRLILASASPARYALLRAAGLTVEVIVSSVDEDAIEAALGLVSPARLAEELAIAKAAAVAAKVSDAAGPTVVIGCDTLLDLDGVALGRPIDAADAISRWHAMRGRTGVLLTGHAVIRLDEPGQRSTVAVSTVHFGQPTDAQIEAYVASGESTSVAGAFTIDGLGGAFITGIEGDAANVAGLSLPVLRSMLHELGIEWTSLWPDPGRERPSRWP